MIYKKTTTPKIELSQKRILTVTAFTVIHLLILFFMHLEGFLKYEVKDDFVISAIASGAFGEPSPYLEHTNIILGEILCILSDIFPFVNWLTCAYLTISVLSISLFCYVMVCKHGFLSGQLLAYSTLFLLIPIIYGGMNFTKFAGLFTIIGFILILFVFEESIKSRFLLYAGGILIIAGSLIRLNAFLLVLPFSIPMIITIVVNRSISREKIRRFFFVLAIIGGIVFLCSLIDSSFYRFDERWNAYKAFNRSRSEIFDYTLPPYEENTEEYQQLGLSENDLTMIKSGRLSDSRFFSTDILDRIVTIRESTGNQFRTINKLFIKQFLINLFFKYLKNNVMIIVLIISVLFLVYRKDFLSFFSAWGLCLAELAFLECLGRPIDRVTVLPMLGILFLFMYHNIVDEVFYSFREKTLPVLLILLISSGMLFSEAAVWEPLQLSSNTKAFVADIKNADGLYVCNAGDIVSGYSIFDPPLKDGLANMVFESGWLTQFPYVNDILSKHLGTDNLYGSILSNPELYFVQHSDEARLIYLREHYNPHIGCSFVDNKYGYNIFTYSAPLENASPSDVEWDARFQSKKCLYDDSFFQMNIDLITEINPNHIYLEICDLKNETIKYTYKIVETEEGLTCYFDSKDWSNTAQAKCSLYYSDTDGNKISNKTLYITF